MTPNPEDLLLWALAAVIFGCTALVLTVLLFWERGKRERIQHEYGELRYAVRRFVGDRLKAEGRDPSDFCEDTDPKTQLFLISPDGERDCYRLPPRRPQE